MVISQSAAWSTSFWEIQNSNVEGGPNTWRFEWAKESRPTERVKEDRQNLGSSSATRVHSPKSPKCQAGEGEAPTKAPSRPLTLTSKHNTTRLRI